MKEKARNIAVGIFALMLVLVLGVSLGFALSKPTALTALADEPEVEITDVGTWNELLNAVNSDKPYIRLTNDIEDEVPDDELPTKHRLVFNGGVDYILDLNGNRLAVYNYANEFYGGQFSMVAVSNSSNLEIKNGSLSFTNWYANSNRQSRGVVSVTDDSTLVANRVDMYNNYTGTIVHATDNAKVTINGGDYTVTNGFAIYLERQASLTLDGGVQMGTKVGDSTATVYVDGYGALYSESTGELVVNYAYFNTGIQVHESQVGAFSVANHELVVNGEKQAEDIYYSDMGNQFSALNAEKEYYWYKNGYSRALYKVENPLFANAISVISYDKKYPIDVKNGTAKVGGEAVTEVSYGQTVTIVADPAAQGMEFVRWDTNGVELADYFSNSTTFTMPPAPAYIAAYYGNESIKSVSVSVGDIVAGEKAYATAVEVDGDLTLQTLEWYENLLLLDKKEIFRPGQTYELKLLVYPPEDYKFADNLTATVNGKNATVNSYSGHAIIDYTFDALEGNPFPVIYNTSTAKLGIGGLLELDTALMSAQNSEFKAAFDAGTVTYQWYKDGEPIEGATSSAYNFTAEDSESSFYVTVTAGGKTAWGVSHKCNNYLYQIYLSASDFAAGGKAPIISSATPGVSINPESLFICEGYGQPALDIQKTVLIPGKTYLVIGTLVPTGEASIPYDANVYVNNIQMDDNVDANTRFFYKFTLPEADYPVYYTANGAIGIGVTLMVDVEKMCNESGTFKHACEAANPTYQTVFYQWNKNGEAIKGATNSSYTIKTTDRDSYINCTVTLVDGKFGIGNQYEITNVVTVFNVQMPYPKNGETRIEKGDVSVGEANVSGIMWWPKETQVEMQGSDTYVEGTVYEFYIMFSCKDGFAFADAEDRTVYVYDEKATHNSGYAYMGEVTAIHKHMYDDNVWDHDEYAHWQPCVVPNCPDPNEEWIMYTDHAGGEATCQTPGQCAICGAEYYADHDFSVPDYQYVDEMKCANFCENCDVWVDWSYHSGGVTTCHSKAICEFCHHEYGNYAPHTMQATPAKAATCTANGNIAYWHCTECDKYFSDANGETEITLEDTVVEKIAHTTVEDPAVPATCLQAGLTAGSHCSVCGEVLVAQQEVPALGHDMGEWQVVTPATETEEGLERRACSRCDHVEERAIPIIGHVHTIQAVAAKASTCEVAGNIAHYECTGCHRLFSDANGENQLEQEDVIIAALGHDWGEWVVTTPAQVGVKGVETRTCARDNNHTETREIPALPYPTRDDDGVSVVEATATQGIAKDVAALFEQAKTANGKVELTAGNLKLTFNAAAVNAIGGSAASLTANVLTENFGIVDLDGIQAVIEINFEGATFANGSVKVELPFATAVPSGKVAKVYYINGNDKTDMNAVFADGKVTFETNHFSKFAVVFEDATTPTPVDPTPSEPEITPNTEKGGLSGGAIAGIVIAVVAVLAGAGVGCFFLLKKKGGATAGADSAEQPAQAQDEQESEQPEQTEEGAKSEDSDEQ